ncbi:MAG: hypothetical protein WC091_25530, partial [Sulfuricellaceae bacterium]
GHISGCGKGCFSLGDKAHSRHLAFCICQGNVTTYIIFNPFTLRQAQGERIKNNVGITSAYVPGQGQTSPFVVSLSNHERGSLTLPVSDADIIQPTKQTSASRVLKTQYEPLSLWVAAMSRVASSKVALRLSGIHERFPSLIFIMNF